MNTAGNVFFTGSCLTADKDCCACGGDLPYEFAHFTHFAGVADEFSRDSFDDVADLLALDEVLVFDGFEVFL